MSLVKQRRRNIKAKNTHKQQHSSTPATTESSDNYSPTPATSSLTTTTSSSPTPEPTTATDAFLPLAGRVVVLRDASAQFLALCMLTHHRCGGFGKHNNNRQQQQQREVASHQSGTPTTEVEIAPSSLGVGIRFVWEWVLNEGPVRWFNVSVARQHLATRRNVAQDEDEEWEALFTVGVSEAIMGVVPRLARSLVRDTHGGRTRIIGANATRLVEWVVEKPSKRWLHDEKSYIAVLPPLLAPPTVSGIVGGNSGQSDRVLMGGPCMIRCVNHKWLVARELEDTVTVVNLQQLPASAKVIPCMRGMHVLEMFMDEYRCDEALFIVSTGDNRNVVQAYVVDVEELWSSVDTFSPISSTRCSHPTISAFSPYSLRKWLVLHTESNKRAFVVVVTDPRDDRYVLQYAESPDDPAREALAHSARYVCPRLELSQLSDRLYCVSASDRQYISGIPAMEIWDCNVPSHPLRVIECNIKDTCEQILFGHAGFLFHLTGDRVVVSDWESGTKLAILTYKGKDKKRFKKMSHTRLSFLL